MERISRGGDNATRDKGYVQEIIREFDSGNLLKLIIGGEVFVLTSSVVNCEPCETERGDQLPAIMFRQNRFQLIMWV